MAEGFLRKTASIFTQLLPFFTVLCNKGRGKHIHLLGMDIVRILIDTITFLDTCYGVGSFSTPYDFSTRDNCFLKIYY